jgi:hypothetical protein
MDEKLDARFLRNFHFVFLSAFPFASVAIAPRVNGLLPSIIDAN